MANRSKAERDTLVTVAAGLFVTQTRDAEEIAEAIGASKRTVHRYAETEQWDEVLKILGYKGDRNFRIHKAGRKRKAD